MKKSNSQGSDNNNPRRIQKQSSTASEGRDVVTIIQQDDQELAEAKIRAQQARNLPQERVPSPALPPTLQSAQTGRDVVTILREDDQELAEEKARANSSSPRRTAAKKPTSTASTAAQSKPSTAKPSGQHPPHAHQMNFFSNKNAKGKAKSNPNNNTRQYANRSQAAAVNMALRDSQQDTPADINRLTAHQEGEEKREEGSELFSNEMVLIDGTSEHHPSLNRGGGNETPLVNYNYNAQLESSQPGAFRVGTSLAPAESVSDIESEGDISWGDEDEQDDAVGMTEVPVEEENSMDGSEKSQVEEEHEEEESISHNSNIDTGDILVEATLVTTEEVDIEKGRQVEQTVIFPEPELVTAERMSETYGPHEMIKNRYGRRWILGVILLVLFVVVVASIVIGVVVSSNKNDSGPQATETPTMAPTSFLEDALPESTQLAIEDSNTAQARAYQWYLEDQEYISSMTDLEGAESADVLSYVPIQRFALATLYYATNGDGWLDAKNWLDHDESDCNWFSTFFGSICSPGAQSRRLRGLQESTTPTPLYLNRLSLNKNNITGTFVPEMALLSNLDVLNIHQNYLSGTIPTEFGTFKHITLFQLFDNWLSGTIPSQLGLLPKVRQLNLAFNQLTGTIPTTLSQLGPTLESLSASNNLIEGTIPTELGNLSNLEGMYFYNTPNLTGLIPSELGLLTAMTQLQLNTADFTGMLPSELGLATALRKIYLSDNWNLQGTIPESWGNLTNLVELQLHNTGLTGTVPEGLCDILEAGTISTLSVDCDMVYCNCSCTCYNSTGPNGGEQVTDWPIENDTAEGDELITDAPIVFATGCETNATNATNASFVNCDSYGDGNANYTYGGEPNANYTYGGEPYGDEVVTNTDPVPPPPPPVGDVPDSGEHVEAPGTMEIGFTQPPSYDYGGEYTGAEPPEPIITQPEMPPEYFDEAELYDQPPDVVSERSGSSNIFSH